MADRVSDSVIFAVTGNYGRVGFGLVGGVPHRDADGAASKHADIVIAVAKAENALHGNMEVRSQSDHGVSLGAARGHDVDDFMHGSSDLKCFPRGKHLYKIIGGLIDQDLRKPFGRNGKILLIKRDERGADLLPHRSVVVVEKGHVRTVRAVKDTVLAVRDKVKAPGNERFHEVRHDVIRKTVLVDRRVLTVVVDLGAVTCDDRGGKAEFFDEFPYHMEGSSGRDRKAGRRRKRADRGHCLIRDLSPGGKKRIINVTDDQTIQGKRPSR